MNEMPAQFKATDAFFTDEGLVIVCPDEAESQRAFCEAQLKKCSARLDGNRLILLAWGKP